MDRLIQRQLRRAKLSAQDVPTCVEHWQAFLEQVDRCYRNHQEDRYLLERSLEISSREMQALYETIRRDSASEVAAERDKLEALINGFRDGFCTLDLGGRLLSMNPAAARLFGGSPGMLGETVLERFSLSRPSDSAQPPEPAELLGRVLNHDSYRDDNARLQRAGGESLPISLLIYPIVQAGKVTGCALSMRDLTRLRNAEAARMRMAKAVEASADAIYVTDLNGTIHYVNPAFTRISGLSAEQAVGAGANILSSGKTPLARYEQLWGTITSGEIWFGRLLNQRVTADGGTETYWAQTTIAPLPDDAGELVGFVAVQRDITREVAEESRRRRETQMVEARARAAERLQGAGPLDQRLGAALDALQPLRSLRLNGSALIAACLDGEPVDVKLRRGLPSPNLFAGLRQTDAFERDPSYRPASDGILLPLAQGGHLIGAAWLGTAAEPELDSAEMGLLSLFAGMVGVAIADDRARAEAERARLAALEAVEARSRFLANMSHEIRTPMNGVLGMLQMLSQTPLNPDQRDFVDTALASADGLLTVINDILDFSKVEAGKLDLERAPFDVRPLAEEVSTLLACRNESGCVELACFIPVDLETRVVGDSARLRQVLNNLLGNAVKFTQRGEVVLQVRADEARSAQDGRRLWLRFEISDTGIGMTEEQLAGLFVPFAQADNSTTRRFGGTGLGLVISKQLVELMGGEIGVESQLGRGSTFWFLLPFERQAHAEPLPEQRALRGLRALAVDDNTTNLKILAHYLRSWEMACDTLSDGAAALGLLRNAQQRGQPYDIAVLDGQMPKVDGLELASQIKADPNLAQIGLLMISSGGLNEADVAAVGVQYSLSKPIRQAQLRETLLQIVQPVKSGISAAAANIALPAVASSSTAKTGLGVAKAPGAGLSLQGRVLIAEDNEINQRVALSMVERLGLTADLAANGRDALEAIGRQHYDLILMDCQMPIMDGFEASAELRRREALSRGPRIVIVALTASAMQGDRERCIAAGMDDYLPKPLNLDRLKHCLQRWLAVEQSAMPNNPQLLAQHVIRRLQGLGPSDDVRPLDRAARKAESLMGAIRRACGSRDRAGMAAAAHALKVCATELGAQGLIAFTERLKSMALEADFSDIEPVVEALSQHQDQVLLEFQRMKHGERHA